jgi:hypothetical protein
MNQARTERSAPPQPRPEIDRIHGGTVLELDGDRVFNTSVLFRRSGKLVAMYTGP